MMQTRLLDYSECESILDLLASREHIGTGSKVTPAILNGIISNAISRGSHFIGVFVEDGEMDACGWWYPIGQAPRADDHGRSEPAAVIDQIWTRKRPQRVKLPNGDDVGCGTLLSAVVEDIEASGIYTHYTMVPTAFRAHAINTIYAARCADRRTMVEVAHCDAGGLPVGPLEDFIRGLYIGSALEAMTFRAHTVLDEHRP